MTTAPAPGKAPARYWNPYLGGALLGLLLFLSFFVTGNGLGASGALNRVVVAAEGVVAQEHVDTTPYLAEMGGADRNPLDHWMVLEILGILLGGLVSGLVHKRVRPETFKGPRVSAATRLAFALIGGAVMGYGARLARGCTSGQGLSGGSAMSEGSWLFLLAMFASAYVVAIFARRLWR
ncbi:MAG: hypothetical protein EP329_04785 [Deltaproteobacteria bacterium]|nr:MAG: hypothetical protein EP329_04785 [Deltaproteobacteria bacterium]